MAETKDESRLERLHRRLHEETMEKIKPESRLERLRKKLDESAYEEVDKNIVAESADNVEPEDL